MRKGLAGLCGLCLLGGLMAGTPLPRASAKASTIDKELLGVRLLQSYKTVLQMYGAPTRVLRADEAVELLNATDLYGKETGGVKGFSDTAQGGGMTGGGRSGGMGGMMGGSGGPMGPPMGMPGMPGGMGGMMGGKGGRDDMGGPPAGLGGGGSPLGGSTAASGKPETFAESGGYTWIYFYPREELAYIFGFNADGRVEVILEQGRYKGKPSSRGIHLGQITRDVYNTYGWPDTVDQQVNTLVLNYNLKHHAQFATLNGKVVKIAVFLKEDQLPRLISVTSNAGGGGGRPGAAGGGGRGGKGGGGGGGGMAGTAD